MIDDRYVWDEWDVILGGS